MHIDADVALWLDYRRFQNISNLRILQCQNFVAVNHSDMDEFDKFKEEIALGSSVLKCNNILNLWISTQKDVHPYQQYDSQYVLLQSSQVDDLCEWVTQLREKVQRNGRIVLEDLIKHTHSQVAIIYIPKLFSLPL